MLLVTHADVLGWCTRSPTAINRWLLTFHSCTLPLWLERSHPQPQLGFPVRNHLTRRYISWAWFSEKITLWYHLYVRAPRGLRPRPGFSWTPTFAQRLPLSYSALLTLSQISLENTTSGSACTRVPVSSSTSRESNLKHKKEVKKYKENRGRWKARRCSVWIRVP